MTTSVRSDPAELVLDAVATCLDMAHTWYAWDGRPRVSQPTKDIPDGTVFTPHKAIRRIGDHLVDHLAEIEALLAGAETIPDTWHGRTITLAADWAPFSEADLNEARNRLGRLGQVYALRLRSLSDEALDAPAARHGRSARSSSTSPVSPGTPSRSGTFVRRAPRSSQPRPRYPSRRRPSGGCLGRRVQERPRHRGQPLAPVRQRDVTGAWEHRELGTRHAGDVAGHAAAEQPEHLDGVLGADDVGVPDDDQRGRLDRLHGLGRPVLEVVIHLLHLVDQSGPVPRVGRDPGVFLLER